MFVAVLKFTKKKEKKKSLDNRYIDVANSFPISWYNNRLDLHVFSFFIAVGPFEKVISSPSGLYEKVDQNRRNHTKIGEGRRGRMTFTPARKIYKTHEMLWNVRWEILGMIDHPGLS